MSMAFVFWYVICAILAALVAWLINRFDHPTWLSPGKGLAGIMALLLVSAFVQYEVQSHSGDAGAAKKPVAGSSATQRQAPRPEPSPSSAPPASDEPSTPPTSEDPEASPESSDGPTPAAGGSVYLADLEPHSNQSSTDGPATLSGRTYARSALIGCYHPDVHTEYTLGRSRTTLSAELGIDDQMPGGSTAYVTIYGDDRPMGRSWTVKLGRPMALSLDVKNVLKLKFVCTPKVGQEARFHLVLGDAKVI